MNTVYLSENTLDIYFNEAEGDKKAKGSQSKIDNRKLVLPAVLILLLIRMAFEAELDEPLD